MVTGKRTIGQRLVRAIRIWGEPEDGGLSHAACRGFESRQDLTIL